MPANTKTATTKSSAKPAARPVPKPAKAVEDQESATQAADAASTDSKAAGRARKDNTAPDTARPGAGLDIEHYRSLLLAERGRMEAEREQIRNRNLDVDGALPEEGEGGDEDTADLASAMMDKEMDLSVEDEIEDMLAAIDHALQKMEDGTYGICDISGERIPPGRLELIPWASLTVECQALSEGQ